MTYFKNVNTLEELRKQYKDLLKKFHPDNPNGSTADTQAINAEYDNLFKLLKDRHESKTTDNKESDIKKSSYDFAEDERLREVLQRIINFTGITIDLVGAWIWLEGETYQYKDVLKEMGFKWSGQRKKWYWHNGEYKKHGNRKMSYSDIQNYYGSTEVQTDDTRRLKQA